MKADTGTADRSLERFRSILRASRPGAAFRVPRALLAAVAAFLATAISPGAAHASRIELLGPHGSHESAIYTLSAGEKHKGDMYRAGGAINIEGEQDGDLIAFAERINVSGTVTGDLNAMARTVDLSGTMGDSVRVTCDTLTVTGTIKGDLLAFCGTVTIPSGAHITGDVKTMGGQVIIGGKIDGDLEATGGEVTLTGKVDGNAVLKGDLVTIPQTARIGGHLDYTSRNAIDLEGKGIVVGGINHRTKKPSPALAGRKIMKWLFVMLTALIVGLAALALTRRLSQAIVGTLKGETLRSTGVGFITLIVVPVALVLSCILIITIPLALIALALFALAVYLAKTPVAVLVGSRILQAMGRATPTEFQGLAVGIPVLYLLFTIPYLGCLLWFGCLFAGLGAMVLGIWGHVQARRDAAAVGAPPPVAQPAT